MSKICEITGKKMTVNNLVSHANNKTKIHSLPNLQNVKVYSKILDRKLTLKISANGIRTLAKYQSFDDLLLARNFTNDKLISLQYQARKKQTSIT